MAMFTWVVLGILVAGIAKLVAWDDTPIGWAPVLVLGAIGAVAGGFVRGALFRPSSIPGFDVGSLMLAIAGAAVVLYLYYLVIGRSQIAHVRFEKRRAA
ncbi:MAG: GlsB/YeaQ/YmgE family stress response membrane protein [Terriglobales bacterium]